MLFLLCAVLKHPVEDHPVVSHEVDVKGRLFAGIVLNGMAVLAVLPDGDIGAGNAGGRIRHPFVGVDEMGVGRAVILRKTGCDCPNQARAEERRIALYAAAVFAVEAKFGVGVCLKSRDEAMGKQYLGKAAHKVAGGCFRLVEFKENRRSLRNGKRMCRVKDLTCERFTFFFRTFGAIGVIERGDFAAFVMEEPDLLHGERVFSGQISAPEVGVELISCRPFKFRQVVLQKGIDRRFGIDAEAERRCRLSFSCRIFE